MFTSPQSPESLTLSCYQALPETLLADFTPKVLRGFIKDWPALTESLKGSAELQRYLLGFYKQQSVHLMRGRPEDKGRLFYNDDLSGFNFDRQQGSLNHIFDEINAQGQDTLYVGSTQIRRILPGFEAENPMPALPDDAFASIWMGNRSRIAAHFDAPDNIACVLAGRRKVTLFPPEQIQNLYVGPLDFTPAGQAASLVDFHAPDFQRFPKFKDAIASSYSTVLEAGDAIYIPATWWHHIEALDDFNVLVNYWWRQVADYMGTPQDAILHAILAIKALPKEQREAYRAMFEHYVFNPDDNAHIPNKAKGILSPLEPSSARRLRAMLTNALNR